jgi:hypothetical protein
MDDVEVLTATLNNTLQRHGRVTQNYEIEIANMTAEIVRLKAQVEAFEASAKSQTNEKPSSKP